jgi:hypothetical protein
LLADLIHRNLLFIFLCLLFSVSCLRWCLLKILFYHLFLLGCCGWFGLRRRRFWTLLPQCSIPKPPICFCRRLALPRRSVFEAVSQVSIFRCRLFFVETTPHSLSTASLMGVRFPACCFQVLHAERERRSSVFVSSSV